MRKIISKAICLFTAMLLLSSPTAFAAENADTAALLKDIAVPVKYICEAKGGEATWDSGSQTATFKLGNTSFQINLKKNQLISKGKATSLTSRVSTPGGRIVLPLSTVNHELGLKLTNDDYLKLIGVKFMELFKNSRTEECYALLSSSFSKYLTQQYIGMIAPSLNTISFDYDKISLTKNAVHQNLMIPCIIQQTAYTYIIRFDEDGKVDEIASAAPQLQLYTKPTYDDPSQYVEEEVSFGSGEWKLPGTLTMPKGNGPFPVLILVHGSDPSDRDESIGALKPFRDLAVGLAAKNIAVLRYEKRTLEHGTKMQLLGDITMKEEFEEDALAAAEYLKALPGIDPSNIMVLGHSEGGYDLPRIMKSDTSGLFKAGIIMSGCSRPIYELMAEQTEYFMNKGMASQEQVELIKAQAAMIEDPSFDPANPPAGYILGTPKYFNDMKNYDVLGMAGSIDKPVLVLQGQRDFQVNPATDYDGWKKAFADSSSAEFKLYPKLNHLYTETEGNGTPDEYYIPANIPQYVIDDIGDFVNKTAGK